MIKQYCNLAILLFASWMVYSHCQEDMFLPLIAGSIMLLSFLLRIKSNKTQFKFFDNIPLSAVIVFPFIAGLFWRSIFPPPEEAISPFPEMIAAVQSGTIFASILIWMKPFTKRNIHHLTFLAWLTVAVSINVPFGPSMLFIFCFFCIIGTAMIILNTVKKPKEKRHFFRHYRGYIFFSALIFMLTVSFFYGISKTMIMFDDAFMRLMSDYVLPRHYTHFLKIDSKLHLIPPGRSAWDKRPVLEFSIPDVKGAYLKTQVFNDFNNGTWLEAEDVTKKPLPTTLNKNLITGEMTMFTSFDDIIPSATGIVAARGKSVFDKGDNDVLYTKTEQRSHILEFSLTPEETDVPSNPEELAKYLEIPKDLKDALKNISSEIIGDETDIIKKTELLRDFFRNNFEYSLAVNFTADNAGILEMIENRYPAYCTYFATAMTLMLRAEGIPARVATGFLTNEKIDKRRNKFLARVNDAHAWTEALLPSIGETNELMFSWEVHDATPSVSRNEALGKRSGINWGNLTEKFWLSLLRFGAHVENIDKEKLKQNLLFSLIALMLLMNAQRIWARIRNLLLNVKQQRTIKANVPKFLQTIYQRYESYLKETLKETPLSSETDREIVLRLRSREDIPTSTIEKIESFLKSYHAVRFGGKENTTLTASIQELEQS